MTISLGFSEPDDMEVTLSTLMMRVVNEEELHVEDAILHHEEGVDLIPSNIELSALEISMVNVMSRETILRQFLEEMASKPKFKKISFTDKKLNQFFPADYSASKREKIITELLTKWKEEQGIKMEG